MEICKLYLYLFMFYLRNESIEYQNIHLQGRTCCLSDDTLPGVKLVNVESTEGIICPI